MCKTLKDPNQKSWRQLVKTVRYIKGSRDLATFMPRAGKPDTIEAFLDGGWACDDLDRKSALGGYLFDGWWLPITQSQQDSWITRAQQR